MVSFGVEIAYRFVSKLERIKEGLMLDALFSTIIFSCGIAKIIEIGKDLTLYGEIVPLPRLLDYSILTQQPS